MDKTYPKAGVGIIVFKKENGKSYVMLHKRKGMHGLGKDYWGSGGGHLELGESFEAGALRELTEEAGDALVVGNVRFLGVMNFTQLKPKHYVDISFVADWVSGEPTKITRPKRQRIGSGLLSTICLVRFSLRSRIILLRLKQGRIFLIHRFSSYE